MHGVVATNANVEQPQPVDELEQIALCQHCRTWASDSLLRTLFSKLKQASMLIAVGVGAQTIARRKRLARVA